MPPGAAHDRRRRPPLARRPADRPPPARAIPAASRSWPTSTASPAWATRPSCTSAGTGTWGSTRSAAGAPTWRWWSRPTRAARRAGGWRRSCSRRSGVPRAARAGRGRRAGPAGAGHRTVRRAGPAGSTADGAALVGDAADFFDPFTGEGIYSALRGAELLAETAVAALGAAGPVTAADLAAYRRARRRAFAGKWAVERLIGYGMLFPGAVRPRGGAAGAARRHGGHAHRRDRRLRARARGAQSAVPREDGPVSRRRGRSRPLPPAARPLRDRGHRAHGARIPTGGPPA